MPYLFLCESTNFFLHWTQRNNKVCCQDLHFTMFSSDCVYYFVSFNTFIRYTYTRIYIYRHINVYTHVYIYMYTCVYTYICIYTCIHIYTYICIYMYVCMLYIYCIYLHAHTHTTSHGNILQYVCLCRIQYFWRKFYFTCLSTRHISFICTFCP
jgi:hypothetical protein